MAVVKRVVLLASDISGDEGASSFELDIAGMLKGVLKSFPKITLDATEDEAADISDELSALHVRIENDIVETVGYLYEIHAGLKAAGASTSGGAASTGSRKTLDPVRAWAKLNKIPVGDRGVIKADVVAAYHAAMATTPTVETAASWDHTVEGDGNVIEHDGPTDDELAALEDEDATA
ncbi:MAG TPA: histone-like nucleoid-structuring protein Lsr2 [Fibrella sp.]